MRFETLDERIAALSPHWRLHKPDGPGPFGLVVQMHGCGGCFPFQDSYAQAALKAGCAALVVDSYPHRGVSPRQAYGFVCMGLKLWGRERAGDLYAALAWGRGQPFIDRYRLYAAGWSHGGWSVLDAMAAAAPRERARWTRLVDLAEEPLDGLAGAFVVYPYCGVASVAQARGLRCTAPVRAIVCGDDRVVGGRTLQARLEALPKPGAPVQTTFYDAATHSFDEPEAKDRRFHFDPALTERTQAMYAAFLAASTAG